MTIFEENACGKRGGDCSPKHTDNSDEVSDGESEASDKFHCNSATIDTKRSIFTMKAAYECALRTLVIQIVLFLCASSVANVSQMQQWLQQN
jgi:hypothetical protein